MNKKVLIVGGVAGGASAAARMRRLDEHAEIILFERDEHISFANCGLPYYIGGTIQEREKLLVQTPKGMKDRFRIGMCDALQSHFFPNVQVIIDLPVKNNGELPVLHRLFAAFNIENGQPVVVQLHIVLRPGSLFIRAPVPEILCQTGKV